MVDLGAGWNAARILSLSAGRDETLEEICFHPLFIF